MNKFLVTLFFLLLISAEAWAATYYVDPVSGSDANPGTSEIQPKATVGAISQSNGDIILLAADRTFAEQITIGANSITLGLYGQGRARINASGVNYGISATNRTGLTIEDGIDIDGPTLAGVLINCTVGNTSAAASVTGVRVTNVVGNGATIGNAFRWFCADVTLTDTSSDRTYSDGYYCDTCDRAINVRPRVTRFGDGPTGAADANADGIQIVDSDDFVVRDPHCEHNNAGTKLCVVQGVTSNVGGLIEGGELIGGVDAAVSCSSTGCIVRGMRIKDVLAGDGSAAGVGVKLMGNNQRAESNIITNPKKCFFSNVASTSVNYLNNVCTGWRDRGLDANTTNAVTLTAANNVFVGADGLASSNYAIIIGSGVTETLLNNRYHLLGAARFSDSSTPYADLTAWQSAGKESGSTLGDPAFVGGPNPTTPEGFKPFATSPLCGAGYPTAAKYDYDNKRLGNPPNIGAYGTCTAGRTSYSTRSTYVPR